MRTQMSSKGQIVLPKELRDRRGLAPGAEVEIEEVPEGVLLRLVKAPDAAALDDLLGGTGYRGPRRTLAEMEAGIRKGATRSQP
jgi:AbrB family looped-hinge helix DNA binding protein